MSTEQQSWYNWAFGAPGPKIAVETVTGYDAAFSYGVDEDSLNEIKSGLKKTVTRVAPLKYPSRTPHIEEMDNLQRKYLVEQRKAKIARILAAPKQDKARSTSCPQRPVSRRQGLRQIKEE
jgi:hypothetical protein